MSIVLAALGRETHAARNTIFLSLCNEQDYFCRPLQWELIFFKTSVWNCNHSLIIFKFRKFIHRNSVLEAITYNVPCTYYKFSKTDTKSSVIARLQHPNTNRSWKSTLIVSWLFHSLMSNDSMLITHGDNYLPWSHGVQSPCVITD